MDTVTLIANLIEAGDHQAAIQAVNELVETASCLEERVAELEDAIFDLEDAAREKNEWEGRYWELLEECEANRRHPIDTERES